MKETINCWASTFYNSRSNIRLEVLTTMNIHLIFSKNRLQGRTYTLKMEATSSSEMVLTIYKTTWRHGPVDHNLLLWDTEWTRGEDVKFMLIPDRCETVIASKTFHAEFREGEKFTLFLFLVQVNRQLGEIYLWAMLLSLWNTWYYTNSSSLAHSYHCGSPVWISTQ
jgi:hypothetical protein